MSEPEDPPRRSDEPEPYVNRIELQIIATLDVVPAEPKNDEGQP